VFSYRVITGAIILAGSVFASGLFAGDALAQYEPVGKPLQLVPPSYSSKSAATPRSRVTAKKAAKLDTGSETKSASRSEAKPETKTETRQHVSFRRKHRPRTEVAEQRRPQRPAVAAGSEAPAAQVAAKPAAPLLTPAAPLSASLSAPAVPAATAATPAPAPPTTGALMIGGQAVQVLSPDEANELDLAANAPSASAAAPASNTPAPASGSAPLFNLAGPNPAAASEAAPAGNAAPTGSVPPAATAALAAEMESANAEVARPKSSIGSASWIMQIMAALGGAVAAGSAAWFLIGSASPRIKLSEWDEANSQES
jgi:hypothetical protein